MDKIEITYKQLFEKSTREISLQINPEAVVNLVLEMTKQSRLKISPKQNKQALDSKNDELLKQLVEMHICLCESLRQFVEKTEKASSQ